MVEKREPPKDNEEGRPQEPEEPEELNHPANHPAEVFLGYDRGPMPNPNLFFHDMAIGFRAPPPEDSDSEEEADSEEASQEDSEEEDEMPEIIQEPVENGKIVFAE